MLISATGLGHAFEAGRPLFTDLDFEIDEGQLIGLSGPSGSGKTTLLSILAGWTTPSAGRLHRSRDLRLTWIPQNPVGVHQRSAIDLVALVLLRRGMTRDHAQRVAVDTLARFGLGHVGRRRFGSLSGGESQRLMLARASLMDVDLMLVDEPTAQLDATSATAVCDVLSGLSATGRAVIIASHDPRVLDACPQILRLDRS